MITNTLLEIFQRGGMLFMIPLLILSIITMAVIIERVIMFTHKTLLSQKNMDNLEKEAHLHNTQHIVKLLDKQTALLAVILRESFQVIARKNTDKSLHTVVQERAEKNLDVLSDNLWILRAIGHIAPLLGLMGTVVGLAVAFDEIAEQGLSQQSVAGGISMALITTIAGLAIALPTLLADYCLRAWGLNQYRKLMALLSDFVSWFEES